MLALTYDIHTWRWLLCKAAGVFAKRVCWSRLSPLRLREVPIPELPSSEWVRLRTRLGGICGTDLAMVQLRQHPATFLRTLTSFPVVLGHENVAEIESMGSGAGSWRVGQRVCVEPSLSCIPRGIDPVCRPCAEGTFALCENVGGGAMLPGMMIGLNNFTGGSWAPYFVAHRSQLHAVPDELPDTAAVLVDPLACALHAVLRRRPGDSERILIIGTGMIASGVIKSIRALGCSCEVHAVVRSSETGGRMAALGADRAIVCPGRQSASDRFEAVAKAVGGRRISGKFGNPMLLGGYDVVYDCVGSAQSFGDALKFARGRGTVVAVGTSHFAWLDTTPLWFSELRVLGVNGRQLEETVQGPRHTYELVLDLIRNGRLDVSDLRPRVFPVAAYREAFNALTGLRGPRPIKAAFAP